jgi:hypothetical protein
MLLCWRNSIGIENLGFSRKEGGFFLSNQGNKQRFINLLGDLLERDGHHVEHANGDADLLIVETSIAAAQKAPNKHTVLVADDTDILVLLSWHTKPTTPSI